MSEAPRGAGSARVLIALIVGQLGMHAAMAGLRMAAPLQALREGMSAWSVGLLLAMFAAAPVALALHSGRLADRHGYHRPVRIAVGVSLAAVAIAVASTFVDGVGHVVLLCVAAALSGTGTNMGMLTIQRTAGLAARDSAERVRIFSWLGVAPSFANVVGPVVVGFAIDAAGFRFAYAMLVVLPLVTWFTARAVPRVPRPAAPQPTERARTAWALFAAPGMRRLLVLNWLLSMCWDVHSFAVPILGHERAWSASVIGLILGTFTLSVTGIRLVIPLLAHRLEEALMLRAAMVGTGLVFALYPLAANAWLMGACAVCLGITLGSAQPMIMSTLHQLTPDHRHGEALALRSMTINTSSTLMPLLFGAAGSLVGAGVMFWLVGGAVAAGAWLVRALAAAKP
jgi:MFS family permease